MYVQGSGNLGTLSPTVFPCASCLSPTWNLGTLHARLFATPDVVFQLFPKCPPLVTQLFSSCLPDVVSHLSPSCLRFFYRCGLPIVSQWYPSLFRYAFKNGLPLVSDNFQLSSRWGPRIISRSTCLPLTSQMWSSHCLSSVSLGHGFETVTAVGLQSWVNLHRLGASKFDIWMV